MLIDTIFLLFIYLITHLCYYSHVSLTYIDNFIVKLYWPLKTCSCRWLQKLKKKFLVQIKILHNAKDIKSLRVDVSLIDSQGGGACKVL